MTSAERPVLRYADMNPEACASLLARYGLVIEVIQQDQAIPGSFWGDEEAGLKDRRVLVRPDTPIHSVLHEACHYICMDRQRRQQLDTNAGGDYDEENAVCYLQIVLAGQLPGVGRKRMMQDMDSWGYSFRLGSAEAWFGQDADDARKTLRDWGLLFTDDTPTFQLRQEASA